MPTLYRFPILYRLAMRVGYGRDYAARYALVADLVAGRIGAGGSVLELCCGDLALYQHLARRGLVGTYLGLEQSPAMLRLARRRGVDVRRFDVRAGGALPTADAVLMQASFYQFHDVADTLLPRLWAAAQRLLVVAEPVRNVSQSRSRLARWLARSLTRTDGRVHTFRYTEATLLELYRRCAIPVSRLDRTPGGREIVVSSVKAL
jgi:SAM-dependent methyltransferase